MRRRTLVLVVPAILVLTAAHYAQSDAVWQVKCPYVGSNWSDPIVYPAQPGVSHRHDYFGTPADAFTTTESLLATSARCAFGANSFKAEPDDHAGYWAPAIIYKRKPIDMSRTQLDAYYFLGEHHPPVSPFPLGLKIVAGDANATAPQSAQVIRMRCVDNHGGRGPNQQSIPDCRKGPYDTVVIVVLFPECWDGVHLDSTDHKSHMAYAISTGCPQTHPVKVPKLSMTIRYLGDWHGGPGSQFSSGGAYSAHADFWNAWVPERQAALVEGCLNALLNCRYIDYSVEV
jgi:hypothetical protein